MLARAKRGVKRLIQLFVVSWVVAAGSYALGDPLTVPVQGVSPRRVYSTFGARRGGGTRTHEGTDIFARRRTPVVAATWGVVVWRGELSLGGKVLFVFGRRGLLTYYAHLDGYADGIGAGDLVAEGEVIGYVGKTGNARTTRAHLHFETRPMYLAFRPVDPVDLVR